MTKSFGGGCAEALAALGITAPVACCTGCHNEESEGYEMHEREIGDRWFHVCCSVANVEEPTRRTEPGAK